MCYETPPTRVSFVTGSLPTKGSWFDGAPGLGLNHRFVQRVDVVKDLLARRLPPFTDGRPDVETIQALTLGEHS